MFGRQMKLMRLYGFDIKIDASWIFLVFLVVWTLSVGYFPAQISGLNSRSYWVMGLLGAIGLFLSLILHEFSHSLVARGDYPLKGSLYLFSAEWPKWKRNPKTQRQNFGWPLQDPLPVLF